MKKYKTKQFISSDSGKANLNSCLNQARKTIAHMKVSFNDLQGNFGGTHYSVIAIVLSNTLKKTHRKPTV